MHVSQNTCHWCVCSVAQCLPWVLARELCVPGKKAVQSQALLPTYASVTLRNGVILESGSVARLLRGVVASFTTALPQAGSPLSLWKICFLILIGGIFLVDGYNWLIDWVNSSVFFSTWCNIAQEWNSKDSTLDLKSVWGDTEWGAWRSLRLDALGGTSSITCIIVRSAVGWKRWFTK